MCHLLINLSQYRCAEKTVVDLEKVWTGLAYMSSQCPM